MTTVTQKKWLDVCKCGHIRDNHNGEAGRFPWLGCIGGERQNCKCQRFQKVKKVK